MNPISARASVPVAPIRRWRWLFLAAVLVLLAGCSGQRLAATSWPGITVDGQVAYVAFNQELFAIDPDAQRVVWQYPSALDTKSPAYYAAPAVTDGLLAAGGYDSVLYGIDRETLQVVWSFHRATGFYIASPVMFDGKVLAATAGNELFALSLEELERLGTVDKVDEARRSAEESAVVWQFAAKQGIWGAPLVTSETTYLVSLDHHVYALDTETGRQRWAIELVGAMAGTPALSSDGRLLYVGNFDSDLYALDAGTGAQRWQVDAENWVWGEPVLAGDKLFFGDLAGYLYAVQPETGEVLWQDRLADAIRGGPTFDPESGRLYVTGRKVANPGSISTRGVVVALDAESYRVLWEQATAEAVYTSPALAGDMVLVAPAQGQVLLQVYSAETGVLQWEYIPHPETK